MECPYKNITTNITIPPCSCKLICDACQKPKPKPEEAQKSLVDGPVMLVLVLVVAIMTSGVIISQDRNGCTSSNTSNICVEKKVNN